MRHLLVAVSISVVGTAAYAQATPETATELASDVATPTAEGAAVGAAPSGEVEIATDPVPEAEPTEVELTQSALQTMTPEELEALVKRLVEAELQKVLSNGADEDTATRSSEARKRAIRLLHQRQEGFVLPDFSRTGITFIMGDDNLRDDSQYSAAWDIGQRPEYEDFFQRVYGYSNTAAASTRLTLFHREEGLLPNLSTEIGLAFKVVNKMDNIDDKLKTNIFEDKSFVALQYILADSHRFKLTLYPYNADRIAIGYFRGLRWGTRDVYPQIDRGTAVPGFQLVYATNPISAYFGFKTHAQEIKDKLNREFVPKETVYSLFTGVSLNDFHGISAHVQGAFIDKGENPKLDDAILPNPKDDQIHAFGLNIFAEYVWGAPIGDPLGINAYNNREWVAPSYEGDFALRGRGELTLVSQLLMNADYLAIQGGAVVEPVTKVNTGYAVAGEVAGRFKIVRAMGLFTLRSLSFLAFDSPGVNPFETISSSANVRPEIALSFHSDVHVSIFWFGAGFGYKIPATYTVFDQSGQAVVTVIKDRITSDSISYAFDRTREVLPTGRNASNMLFLEGKVKAQFSKSVSALIEYSFTIDHNRAKLVEYVQNGVGTGTFITDWDSNRVREIHGLYLAVEGRF